MANWNQPLCTNCWIQQNSVPDPGKPDSVLMRTPVRLLPAERPWQELIEQCCMCGRATTAQIFFRVDPDTVPFPQEDE